MKKVVFFTGAGVSAESGISTFRDSNGLWENHNIHEVASPEGWRNDKETVLRFYNARRQNVLECQPNAAHVAIAELAASGEFDVKVITQNVDDLHERAGSTDVIHLHGELLKSRSTLDPSLVYECRGDIKVGDKCERGSQLRPHIVWFGEALDHKSLKATREIADEADYFVIVGTSMQVMPAAGVPFLTQHGTPIFYVDPGEMNGHVPTSRKNDFMHVMANATTGVPRVIQRIKEMENGR